MCTSILLNLLANNAPNKEFVYRNHVTHALRGVLEQTELLMFNPQHHPPNDGSTIEEIQVLQSAFLDTSLNRKTFRKTR